MSKNNDEEKLIAQSKCWIESVIIGHNYCPFAKREVEKGRVKYKVLADSNISNVLEALIQECIWLDQYAETETTLIIPASGFDEFDSFLELLVLAEDLLVAQGYEGIYQLASFHPKYCFQGAEENDPANYTNRSPYPMLHLIREKSIELALENYPAADAIPERNIEHARVQGLEKMQSLLAECVTLDINTNTNQDD